MSHRYDRFKHLTFDAFRRRATDPSLSVHEKVGFPNEYREGREEAIFADVVAKLPALAQSDKTVLEIGPGCSRLPVMLIDLCARQRHRLILIDSAEMLDQLPDASHVTKLAGRFPECGEAVSAERIDVLLAYSVIQYCFSEGNLWAFLDSALALLAPGGAMLLGDVPNSSMRRRFFASAEGVRFHRQFTGSDTMPEVEFNVLQPGQIDDSVVLALLLRARAQGFDAFVLPQGEALPMSNRREDVLVRRP